ncbi:MAG: helix-hairpin-helix domain-containing protein [Candidatus Omnitrophica bacterium]|nr:helix-hairpin-helix domain-containing protein [Candidatus Omnitrophota bacterium]
MIAYIYGKLLEKEDNSLLIDTGGIIYRIYVSSSTLQRLSENINTDGTIRLVTYHYLQVEPSRNIPVLIGFLNEVEKEFFEIFITVSGIGPRAALKALNKPISSIANAIYGADIDFLKSLPGIGEQRAKEIVAKLQNKVGKFGLIQDEKIKIEERKKDIADEAVNVLLQLQYKKQEALMMVKKALERNSDIKTTEELLNEIYRQRSKYGK